MVDLAAASAAENGERPPEGPLTSVLVGLAGFEPATSSLSGMRSNRLSYSPAGTGEGTTGHSA